MDRKKRNTLVFGAVLLILLTAGYWIQRAMLSGPAAVAVIRQEGKELYRLDLSEDASMTIHAPDGGYNNVTVRDGAVFVTDADCPDLTCVHTGKAWQDGQVIACLPHGLIIFVEEGE